MATLGGTIAYEILLGAAREYAVVPVSYEDDTHPYTDLVVGRVDAVLLDNIIAQRLQKKVPGFVTQPDSDATGHYVGLLARANTALRDRINELLLAMMRDGSLGTDPRSCGTSGMTTSRSSISAAGLRNGRTHRWRRDEQRGGDVQA